MEEGGPPDVPEDLEGLLPQAQEEELNRRELKRQLKEAEQRWREEGDSETLWERLHELLILLQRAGDLHSVMKRARRAKRALSSKGGPLDMAQASLGLWVLERYSEAETVLRRAVQALPGNRYPWSLVIRHLTWDRDPAEAIAFIEGDLDRVPWRVHALVQLGTLHVDAASRRLVGREFEGCREHLQGARKALEDALSEGDCTGTERDTVGRLMILVETLERREEDRRSQGEVPSVAEDRAAKLERQIFEVAQVSGVPMEGQPDEELDLDELEREARMELEAEEEDAEETYSVLEVTPKGRRELIRRRRGE